MTSTRVPLEPMCTPQIKVMSSMHERRKLSVDDQSRLFAGAAGTPSFNSPSVDTFKVAISTNSTPFGPWSMRTNGDLCAAVRVTR